MMEQDLTGLGDATHIPNDATNIPGNLPNDIDEPGSAELAADLRREEATGPVPLGPATPEQGEDMVLFVETATSPEPIAVITPTEAVRVGADVAGSHPGTDQEEYTPWYRSRWLYLGAGLAVTAAALSIGTVVLVRNLNQPNRGRKMTQSPSRSSGNTQTQTIARIQDMLAQWTNQLSGQASKPSEQTQGQLTQLVNQLGGQASKLTGQAQGQLSRLISSTPDTTTSTPQGRSQISPGSLLNLTQQQWNTLLAQAGKLSGQVQGQLSRLAGSSQGTTASSSGPTQQQISAGDLLKLAQQQWNTLSSQTSGQLRSLGATTRDTATRAVSNVQGSVTQMGQGMATGAAKTSAGVKQGWRLGRNFTLGAAGGMLWAYLFAQQNGEATRQRLSALLPSQLKNK